MKILKLPKLAYNFISAVGAAIASIIFLLIVILFLAQTIIDISSPYIGIFLFMVLPPVMIFGLFLIPVGMYWHWRKMKRGGEISRPQWPYLDLNKRSHRNATIVFMFGTIIFVTASGIGTYQAFHFTESVSFCGTTCHTVMNPEYTTYQNSPHARVSCTGCHVGSGAGWYTKSKLSGAYQVYAVIADIYPRPIPTPIENLRPARETCEQCHWPEKSFGSQQYLNDHYLYDENNTHWPINMLMKTGGGDPEKHEISGIHWHVSSGFKVEYIARDEDRQDIPWVRLINKQTSEVTIYRNTDDTLEEEDFDTTLIRAMDCIDCHNRPSHIFNSPDFAVDQFIQFGKISREIPEIKRIAVEALDGDYKSKQDAIIGISSSIKEFYQNEYPELYSANNSIDDISKMVNDIYSSNIFPEMEAKWSDYPNNIGHFYDIGCMRCHGGSHESAEGSTITHTCTGCHIILSQGNGISAQTEMSLEGLEFKHPVDIDEAWKEIGCYECHTGIQP